ncbi:DUF397 domain-containing protein [Streptomyces sp. NPDC005373]|uniref:DUF397 domain-containing protein n=1 Tax=Streptomyces sp. NPDC005373 TaxID=3156879 RepID=UPI0033A25B75
MSNTSTPRPSRHDLSTALWRKSSYSGGANDCVEIAEIRTWVAIRDSKNSGQEALLFRRNTVSAFTTAITTSHR